MLKLLEFPWLLLLNFWNHFYTFWHWLQEVYHYYRFPPLLKADLIWMLEYLWRTPFALSRKATQEQNLPEDLTTYGETPWTTLETICREIHLQPEDIFVELGFGTGRNLLFIPLYFHCRAIGFELIPAFVNKMPWLLHSNHLTQSVTIYAQNWLEADLSQGSVFFLVGTCYSDEHLQQATQKLREVSPGARIVTVSWPLTDSAFKLLHQKELPFSWGRGTVYFHQRQA